MHMVCVKSCCWVCLIIIILHPTVLKIHVPTNAKCLGVQLVSMSDNLLNNLIILIVCLVRCIMTELVGNDTTTVAITITGPVDTIM